MWQNIKYFIKNNIIELIALLIPFFIAVYNVNTKTYKQRKKMLETTLQQRINQKKEKLFFQNLDSDPKQKFFKNIPLFEIMSGNLKKPLKKIPICKAYILLGEAGCGKSTVLKKCFAKSAILKKYSLFFTQARGIMYTDAQKLLNYFNDETKLEELCDELHHAKYKSLILYVDGLDEIGVDFVQNFYRFVEKIQEIIPSLILRISCRTEFKTQQIDLSRLNIYRIFEIQKWSVGQLKEYYSSILSSLRKQGFLNTIGQQKLEYLKNEVPDFHSVQSPLLVKMVLYIRLFHQTEWKPSDNIFDFYSVFIRTLIQTYESQNTNVLTYDIDSEMDKVAHDVFLSYSAGNKCIKTYASIAPILKQKIGETPYVTFTHETFYEYFVSRYYHNQFEGNKLRKEAIEVLSQGYSNSFADFITQSFLGDSSDAQMQVVKQFATIYSYTLSKGIKNLVLDQWNSTLKNIPFAPCQSFQAKIDSLLQDNFQKYFTLKYEIIFRLGRLPEWVCKAERIKFLELVYQYDDVDWGEDTDYFSAVLKRCCAISSSFIGGEKIEIDYVYHMLPFEKSYNENYNLANRSHTLIYYGDVQQKNIFTFRDTNPNISWDYARRKRINRLCKVLPRYLKNMNSGDRRKYYFRLFDIATIYTFLENRHTQLSPNEIEVITNFQTDFIGMSEKRKELLHLLKRKTLELLPNE